MVKIKEGYVMSAAEKAEFERQDALPRRTSGKVDYYFKPQTKYLPRIYVFMQAELWCDRNRRPMGLQHAFPFLSRPMNREELEYHHFNWRLCYHQYESWDRLLAAEQQEAEELDREQPGRGTAFLETLASLRPKYPLVEGLTIKLTSKDNIEKPEKSGLEKIWKDNAPLLAPAIDLGMPEAALLQSLAAAGNSFSASLIAEAMETEQRCTNRKPVIFALRFLYRKAAGEVGTEKHLDIPKIVRCAAFALERTRRNFVRRTFKSNPLFALAEIRQRYPDYSETSLAADLQVKSKKQRRKKHKPATDLRRCQLIKLAALLRGDNLSPTEYHQTCQRIALMQKAHDMRSPVRLKVRLAGKSVAYGFNWKARENVIKSFVDMANTPGMTHERLAERHREIIQSNYSF